MIVSEFKSLSGVIVDGDKLKPKLQESITIGVELGVMEVSGDLNQGHEIISFAWRNNTGVAPSFTGKVEVLWQNAHIESISVGDYIWSLSGSVYITKWRPCLDQPSLKPTNGVTVKPRDDNPMWQPSIGTKLKFNHDIDGDFGYLHSEKYGWEDGDSLEVIHKTTNHNGCEVFIVLNTQPDVLTTAVIGNIDFFDTRTPKQKAVDEVMNLLKVRNTRVSDITVADLIGALYDSELLKEMLHEKL